MYIYFTAGDRHIKCINTVIQYKFHLRTVLKWVSPWKLLKLTGKSIIVESINEWLPWEEDVISAIPLRHDITSSPRPATDS